MIDHSTASATKAPLSKPLAANIHNTPQGDTPHAGLVRSLVQNGVLDQRHAEELHERARNMRTSVLAQVVEAGHSTSRNLAIYASHTFGLPFLDLDCYEESSLVHEGMDLKMLSERRILPIFKRGNQMWIATADPSDAQTLDNLRFQTNLKIRPVVVEFDKQEKILDALIHGAEDKIETAGENIDLDELLEGTSDEELQAEETQQQEEDAIGDSPVVRLIRKILIDAIQDGASDIHFEPYEKYYRIRFRVDGDLREVMQPPRVVKNKIASRIKVMSRLNIAEKRVPQDGRTKIMLSRNKAIDFRVSTLPTLHGEKIVMRILDSSSATLGIDALGYEASQRKLLLDAVTRPYGMVLVTGPTGSGKTVSLYTCLNILNEPGVNISTAEDPAEINLAGINQVNVDEKAGLTFASALRAFLRQDPDIIMVGEIRDLETAEISIKAAQTGHMVLSTLHTNDAPQTLTRLMNMGVPTFNIASSVNLITAQRLARRLCTCKQLVDDLPPETLLQAGFSEKETEQGIQIYVPGSCERCNGAGYKGRVGIYQVMPISEEMQSIILANGSSLDLERQAKKEGVDDLRRAGLNKVLAGMTSLDEVLACTNE